MTINVGLVTSEALILGCDSISSISKTMIDPFKGSGPYATDENGEFLKDKEGNLLIAFKNPESVVTATYSGVTKMFKLYEHNGTVVAGTTAGQAKLNDRTIASLASEFYEHIKERKTPFANVKAVANSFYKFMRKEYELDQKDTGVPEEFWSPLEFLVGGHGRRDKFPSLYRIQVQNKKVDEQFADGECGVAWAGQADNVERLIRGYDSILKYTIEQTIDEIFDAYHNDMCGGMTKIIGTILNKIEQDLPDGIDLSLPVKPQVDLGWSNYRTNIDYANLPLQDALDFVSTLVMTQSGVQKFSRGTATVGGRTHIGIATRSKGFDMLNEPTLEHKHTGFTHD